MLGGASAAPETTLAAGGCRCKCKCPRPIPKHASTLTRRQVRSIQRSHRKHHWSCRILIAIISRDHRIPKRPRHCLTFSAVLCLRRPRFLHCTDACLRSTFSQLRAVQQTFQPQWSTGTHWEYIDAWNLPLHLSRCHLTCYTLSVSCVRGDRSTGLVETVIPLFPGPSKFEDIAGLDRCLRWVT